MTESPETTHVHAFCDDALGDADAVEVARRIAAGEISAVEAVESAIARAGKVEPLLNGIVCDRFEAALTEAAGSANEGAFAGVPTFVKDNTPAAGLPTDQGSRAVNSKPAQEHSAYAAQYLSAGFHFLGKSRLPEFGLNASTEFADAEPTRNPWNTGYSCGASSGGSAALVASGVVPIAHANDGGGSIRIPAAACGLVGLKPTRGRHVDNDGARAMPLNIIGEGVVTRSVRDTAAFHAAMETHWQNPALPPLGLVEGPGARRLRVGLAMDSITVGPDAETRTAIEATAARLEALGHRVEPLELPFGARFEDDFLHYWGALAFAIHRGGRWTMDPSFDAKGLENLTRELGKRFGRRFYKLPFVLRRMKQATQAYAALFENVDVLVSPVLAHTTPRLGHLGAALEGATLIDRLRQYVAYTPASNAVGAPAISLPVAQNEAGLPLAAHIMGAHGDERTLLELAFELEADQPWRRIQD